MATTANQQLPYPTAADDPNVPQDIQALAEAVDKKVVMVFASVSDRSTRVPAPTAGMLGVMNDTDTVVFYDGAAWKTIYPPPVPAVTNGTTVPSNSSGANGDVFYKF
jgi:hypothetical protein